jgi:hypothetical protein
VIGNSNKIRREEVGIPLIIRIITGIISIKNSFLIDLIKRFFELLILIPVKNNISRGLFASHHLMESNSKTKNRNMITIFNE